MVASNYDKNRLLVMVETLEVYTSALRDESQKLSMEELEDRWQKLLSALYDCFSYAQTYEVFLGEYKQELRIIIENLHNVEKIIKEKHSTKPAITEKFAEGIIAIADKIDNILDGFGWNRVVRPITEAIFHIPLKIIEMFSPNTPSALPPPSYTTYLPPISPPPAQLPPAPPANSEDEGDTVVWSPAEVDEQPKESYSAKMMRELRERVGRRTAGEDVGSE